jgi:hypothetical protein
MSTLTMRLPTEAARDGEPVRRGFFGRWFDTMMAARLRRAELELAHYRHLTSPDPIEQDTPHRSRSNDVGALRFVR